MIRTDFTALFCILIPLPLILGAPVDDVLKQQQQQMSSGAYREEPYWSYYNQDSDDQPGGTYLVKTRGLDSLGRGNILRSLNGIGSEWGADKASNWRFGTLGSPKRGGGLDSLGRGNILRRVNYDDEISNFIHSLGPVEGRNAFLRSLDSLGKGNILKRSVRTISSTQQQQGESVECCRKCMRASSHRLRRRGLASKKLDSLAGDVFGLAKRFDSLSGATFGTQKRNFDEIDRNGFGAFVKRNFDEIDRNGLGFYKRNFDEIDRTGFGAFVKRAA